MIGNHMAATLPIVVVEVNIITGVKMKSIFEIALMT